MLTGFICWNLEELAHVLYLDVQFGSLIHPDFHRSFKSCISLFSTFALTGKCFTRYTTDKSATRCRLQVLKSLVVATIKSTK